MHLHCNGIKYNVSKGPVAHGGEDLGIIWHHIGIWQGQMTRCSHDVAALKNQEDWEGRWDWDQGRKGCYNDFSILLLLLLLFFSNISMFFSKFTSTVYQQLKDRTF